ncbi:esterase/lipase/thioesterase [Ilyonectria robusta]|uniref:esterase/lipase/thioesterase n=1 Tax=Ilyonectria robusta TaxID=1079257 RepID=UPI001E8CFA76|nr:esterase/lipase/thioesterase [Ilyonectria robusta]KAH8654253.1 esterase/lipase/thioesterase [Ilyonectria robusta]
MPPSPIQSDFIVPAGLFAPAAIPPTSSHFDDAIKAAMANIPKWYEVGISKYREMWENGEFPVQPVRLDCATNISIPSREPGRDIICRLLKPQNGTQTHHVFMHIHGGGWSMGNAGDQDSWLQSIADTARLVIVSVGYRLAPEHPGPAGDEDCFDAAEWLILNAREWFGAELAFIGGESAGGHLSLVSALHLLSHEKAEIREFKLTGGLILLFGCYDLGFTPSQIHHRLASKNGDDGARQLELVNLYQPNVVGDAWKNPRISPLYADLEEYRNADGISSRLPPALFIVGTKDFLLDDTIFMSAKWQMAGAPAVVKIFPGATHGFIAFPPDQVPSAKSGMESLFAFIRSRLG